MNAKRDRASDRPAGIAGPSPPAFRRRLGAGLVLAAVLAAGAGLADGGDDPRLTDREAQAEVEAIMSAAAVGPQSASVEAALAVDVLQAGDAVDACFRAAPADNLGDLTIGQLETLRDCIAAALRRLLDRMVELKAMQRNAAFSYSVFSETVRLLTVSATPARAALSPFIAMLEAARAAARTPAQATLMDLMIPVAERADQRLGG